MVRIAVIGGGQAATLHAEAALATPGVELVGVGGRSSGTAGALADAVGVPDLPIDELAARAQGLVVAVPPRSVPDVLAQVPTDRAVLIESPVGLLPTHRPNAITAVNLLHADAVKRAIKAIGALGTVHHLVLRSRATRPSWGYHGTSEFGGGVLLDPAAGAIPVLLAASGTPVTHVEATLRHDGPVEDRAHLMLSLTDGRRIHADLAWVDGPGETELEAAGESGVVTVRLWPHPALEIDGRPVTLAEEPPLVALGFVEQLRRFAAVAAGRAEPWPPHSVGEGVMALAEAAARSSLAAGTPVPCGGRAAADPASILGAAG